jgi:hypothetical protein
VLPPAHCTHLPAKVPLLRLITEDIHAFQCERVTTCGPGGCMLPQIAKIQRSNLSCLLAQRWLILPISLFRLFSRSQSLVVLGPCFIMLHLRQSYPIPDKVPLRSRPDHVVVTQPKAMVAFTTAPMTGSALRTPIRDVIGAGFNTIRSPRLLHSCNYHAAELFFTP